MPLQPLMDSGGHPLPFWPAAPMFAHRHEVRQQHFLPKGALAAQLEVGCHTLGLAVAGAQGDLT